MSFISPTYYEYFLLMILSMDNLPIQYVSKIFIIALKSHERTFVPALKEHCFKDFKI